MSFDEYLDFLDEYEEIFGPFPGRKHLQYQSIKL